MVHSHILDCHGWLAANRRAYVNPGSIHGADPQPLVFDHNHRMVYRIARLLTRVAWCIACERGDGSCSERRSCVAKASPMPTSILSPITKHVEFRAFSVSRAAWPHSAFPTEHHSHPTNSRRATRLTAPRRQVPLLAPCIEN